MEVWVVVRERNEDGREFENSMTHDLNLSMVVVFVFGNSRYTFDIYTTGVIANSR